MVIALRAMGYTYACFISYKRPPQRTDPLGTIPRPPIKHLWLQFAEIFQKKLEERLPTKVGVFRDVYVQPGLDYPREISRSLCSSMCMVALVVPEYFESSWCTAEWKAMEAFEQKRLGPGNRGLIIPVLCVGKPELLRPRFGPRQDIDLRDIESPSRQLNNVKNLTKIASIAKTIGDLARRLPPPDGDCETFSLDIGPEKVTPIVVDPSPFDR